MNTQEAYEKLKSAGVTKSIQTVRKWLREGKIKATRSEYRKAGYEIDEQDLTRFINNRTGNDKDEEIKRLKKKIEKQAKSFNKRTEEHSYFDEMIHSFFNLNETLQKKVEITSLGLNLAYKISTLNKEYQHYFDEIDFSKHNVEQELLTRFFLYESFITKEVITPKQFQRYLNIKVPQVLERILWSKDEEPYIERIYEAKNSNEIDKILDEFEVFVNKYRQRYDSDQMFNSEITKVDYRKELGLPNTATNREVKKEFHRVFQVLHPDKGGNAKIFDKYMKMYDEFKDSIRQNNNIV